MHEKVKITTGVINEIISSFFCIQILMAADVAYKRGARFIGLEDVLFLLRKDKVCW